MLLAIDAGNTNVVFAVFERQTRNLLGEWRVSTKRDRTADEYFVWLETLMEREGINDTAIEGAIISTVVPQLLFNLKTLCHRYFKCEPLIVGEDDLDLGVEIKATGAGADRLLNAVSAHRSYGGPLIVIDFGTATTFDAVDAEGALLGCVICPGVNLSLEALHMAAAKLPDVPVNKPAKVIGTSTVPAMQSGVYWGYVGMIEGLVARIKEEYGGDMTVVATGGLAPLFADATPVIQHVDSDLTVRGLIDIYQRNVSV
ncbi:MAG: type III pantothenate kinase [Alphaproteobacteria bacterium]